MQQDETNPTAALETRLQLCQELKRELIASRAAYAARDLDAIYRHVSAQAAFCMQIRRQDASTPASEDFRGTPWNCGNATSDATRVGEAFASHARKLLMELAAVQRDIRYLNCEQLVLVNGSRRTLNMIANALASFAPTYNRPSIPPLPANVRPQP